MYERYNGNERYKRKPKPDIDTLMDEAGKRTQAIGEIYNNTDIDYSEMRVRLDQALRDCLAAWEAVEPIAEVKARLS